MLLVAYFLGKIVDQYTLVMPLAHFCLFPITWIIDNSMKVNIITGLKRSDRRAMCEKFLENKSEGTKQREGKETKIGPGNLDKLAMT